MLKSDRPKKCHRNALLLSTTTALRVLAPSTTLQWCGRIGHRGRAYIRTYTPPPRRGPITEEKVWTEPCPRANARCRSGRRGGRGHEIKDAARLHTSARVFRTGSDRATQGGLTNTNARLHAREWPRTQDSLSQQPSHYNKSVNMPLSHLEGLKNVVLEH